MIREKGVAQEINGDREECVSDGNTLNQGYLAFCFLRFLIRKEAICLYVYFYVYIYNPYLCNLHF